LWIERDTQVEPVALFGDCGDAKMRSAKASEHLGYDQFIVKAIEIIEKDTSSVAVQNNSKVVIWHISVANQSALRPKEVA
jgi:hypothetical protein